jgi:GTP-binding protein
MMLTVAIVGRPNVGKSTLFNRLVGRREALVDDAPGMTRDRRTGGARLGDLDFTVIDTAGLEDAGAGSLEARMLAQTERAVAEADLVLFLIDARAGITPLDAHFANRLRRTDARVVLVANKCEGRAGTAGFAEAYGLGFGEPIPISAEHGEGMADLYEAIAASVAPQGAVPGADAAAEDPQAPMMLAIVGRPNVGKSTLANRLLGEERLLTGPEPGVTRDAIAVDWSYDGRAIRLVDTAGLRRRARVADRIEKLSVADSLRAVQYAQVVILVLDATEVGDFGSELGKQDLTIARKVVEEGRALVIAANKWDAVADPRAVGRRLAESLEHTLTQVRGVPVVPVSARDGTGLDALMKAVFDIARIWNARVATPDLNRWLTEITERHPPPLVSGRRIRLRYMTQVNIRPPTFALWISKPADLPKSYLRYLTNGLRDAFGLEGVPIRLMLRKGKNPYEKK